MTDESKIILVDFDDTLHATHDTRPGVTPGKPEPGALAALRYLKQRGYKIIILTGRPVNEPKVYQDTKRWLDHYQVPYSDLTNVKPEHYGYVVDNKAIHFDNWSAILRLLIRLEQPEAKKDYIHETPGVDTPYF